MSFTTLERGIVNGNEYFVARRNRDGWTRCWVKKGGSKKNTRRSMRWLKSQKKDGLVTITYKKEG